MIIEEIESEPSVQPLPAPTKKKVATTKTTTQPTRASALRNPENLPREKPRVSFSTSTVGSSSSSPSSSSSCSSSSASSSAATSVLDRLSAEVQARDDYKSGFDFQSNVGGDETVTKKEKGKQREEQTENKDDDDDDVSALLDKLSKQLEDNPAAWAELVANTLGTDGAPPTVPGAQGGRNPNMLSITPLAGFVIKTTITEVPPPSEHSSQQDNPSSSSSSSAPGSTDAAAAAAAAAASAPAPAPPLHPVLAKAAKPGLKLFINLCHSPEIPAPPPATDAEIRAAINAEDNASWKVPMSLAEPTEDKDKAGNPCLVFSACVHTSPYHKAEDDLDFKLFLIELAVEWVEQKSGLKLSRQFQLPKLKSKGELARHWIRRDSKRPGIAEHRTDKQKQQQQQQWTKTLSAEAQESDGAVTISPDYFVSEVTGQKAEHTPGNEGSGGTGDSGSGKPDKLVLVIFLPGMKSLVKDRAAVDIEQDKVLFDCTPSKTAKDTQSSSSPRYRLAVDLKHKIDVNRATAKFSRRSEVLRIRMPILAA